MCVSLQNQIDQNRSALIVMSMMKRLDDTRCLTVAGSARYPVLMREYITSTPVDEIFT
jgi:hypothetical protein